MVEIRRRRNLATVPQPATVRIPAATGIGEGLGRAGAAVQRIGEEAALRDAALDAERELAQSSEDWTRELLAMQEAAPLGADGFEQQVLDAFDEDAAARIERVPEVSRRWLEGQLNRERQQIQNKALVFEATSRLEKRKRDLSDTINLNANAVRTDGTKYEDALAAVRRAIDNAEIRSDLKADVLREAENGIAAAFIRGLNEKDPKTARQLLENGSLDEILTAETKNILVNDNEVELRRLDAERSAAITAARFEIRDTIDLLKKGFNPGAERLIQMESVARADPALADDLAQAQQLFNFQRVARTWTPADLQNWINREAAALSGKKGVKPIEAARLEMGESLLASMAETLRADPLTWAARVGVREIAPLNLTDADAAMSIARRKADAQEVAGYYGVKPRYFTDDEAAQLSSLVDGLNVDGKMQLALVLSEGFGDASRDVFAEFAGGGASTFAHAGGLVAVGALPAARDTFAGMAARTDGMKGPPAAERQMRENEIAGAFAHDPGTALAHADAAEAIYIARAARRGLGEGAEAYDDDLWNRAQQEAAGAVFAEGRQFGGITDYNDWPVVVPRNIEIDDFGDTIGKIRDQDLTGAQHTGGQAVTAAEIEAGWLVTVGHGLYRIALTDPLLGDPVYVPDEGGTEPYILDLLSLLPELQQRPPVPVDRTTPAAGTAR